MRPKISKGRGRDEKMIDRRKEIASFLLALSLGVFVRAQDKPGDVRPAKTHSKPNIVFILADNVGWGDWSVYGGQVPTPRIDALAAQGIRFTNYSVEGQCTPTRSAILTGRMPVRTGNNRVPFPGEGKMGLAPWEYTIAELLSDAGYNTALYGKWHVGNTPGREPNDQGFDEWWGILNTSDEAAYSQYPLWRALGLPAPQIWEGRKGAPSKPAAPFDMQAKTFMDENIAQHSVDYIKRQAKDKSKPFFVYIGLTQIHPPMTAHPDFTGKSTARGGIYADIIGEMDYRVGQILDAIKDAGIENDTIVVLSSDNATGGVLGAGGGSNGPWHGNFFTPPYEGSYRTAAMIRWPGKIAPGVSNEMLSAEDWMPTLAGLAGEAQRMPTDRPIDGINASAYMLGKNPKSGRDTYLFFSPDGELMSVKWNTVKVIFRYTEGIEKPIVKPYLPLLFDLSSDPGENVNLWEYNMETGWMYAPALKAVSDYMKSVAKYPNIKTGQDFDGYKQ